MRTYLFVSLAMLGFWLTSCGRELTQPFVSVERATDSATAVPAARPTPTPKPSPTLLPEAGGLRTSTLPDGQEWQQVYVPGGSFIMGTNDIIGLPKSAHEVTLSGFWIDQTEVTNARYAGCVAVGECAAPAANTTPGREYALTDPKFAAYPVVGVNWANADAYCRWAGGRLPTEAEWEYAARGPESRTYPWGEEPFPCADPGYDALCNGLPAAAGSHPATASWVGALDMVGNVWEWVNDWWEGDYYRDSPPYNPTGPAAGRERVVRGSTGYEAVYASAATRYAIQPEESRELVGFRCVQSP